MNGKLLRVDPRKWSEGNKHYYRAAYFKLDDGRSAITYVAESHSNAQMWSRFFKQADEGDHPHLKNLNVKVKFGSKDMLVDADSPIELIPLMAEVPAGEIDTKIVVTANCTECQTSWAFKIPIDQKEEWERKVRVMGFVCDPCVYKKKYGKPKDE